MKGKLICERCNGAEFTDVETFVRHCYAHENIKISKDVSVSHKKCQECGSRYGNERGICKNCGGLMKKPRKPYKFEER